MLILADEEIPCVAHYFGAYGELILKPGRSLLRQDALEADLLLVRSVTKINAALLHDTNVKFVGSPVTGTDHLDIAWLQQAGIRWGVAAGCNAMAVAEYVVTVIAALQKNGGLLQKNSRAAVVGVGKIGSSVVEKLKILGFDVIQNDPIRAHREKDFISTPIDELADLDLILLHTPLTKEGPYPTYHLIEKKFLQRQKKGCVLLNAGRGSVIDFADLMQYGKHLIWCLDVWENEPEINREVLLAATIASPHIAGHSVQSKYRGIDMIYRLALQQQILANKNIPSALFPKDEISFAGKEVDWRDVVLSIYNPITTTGVMQLNFTQKDQLGAFDRVRKQVVRGHEFDFVKIKNAQLKADSIGKLEQMGLHRSQ